MTDGELLAAYVDGSVAAFRTLVDRYVAVVLAAARRQVGESAAAEDITQAVFIVLARRAKTIRDGRTLPAWLLKVTKYCAIDARRSARRRKRHEEEAAAMKGLLAQRDEGEGSRLLLAELDQALEALGTMDRTAIVLRFMREESMAGVGAALGISEEAAKKRVARAVEKLRKAFGRRGIALPAGAAGATIAQQARAAPVAPPGFTALVSAGALAKGASVSGAALVAQGAIKLMARQKALWVAGTTAVVLVLGAGTYGMIKMAAPDRIENIDLGPTVVLYCQNFTVTPDAAGDAAFGVVQWNLHAGAGAKTPPTQQPPDGSGQNGGGLSATETDRAPPGVQTHATSAGPLDTRTWYYAGQNENYLGNCICWTAEYPIDLNRTTITTITWYHRNTGDRTAGEGNIYGAHERVVVRIANQWYVAPDTGVMSAQAQGTNGQWWFNTFTFSTTGWGKLDFVPGARLDQRVEATALGDLTLPSGTIDAFGLYQIVPDNGLARFDTFTILGQQKQ